MHTATSLTTRAPATTAPSPRRRRTAVIAAGIVAAATAIWAAPAFADTMMTPEGLITEEAKPAVQLIQATFTAKVNVPDWDINKPAWNAEAADATTLDQVLQAVNDNPAKFFVASSKIRTQDVEQSLRGSGFVVTPDGYVVTNAHVVAPSEDELKTAISEDALQKVQEADAASLEQSLGQDLTPAQLTLLTDAITKLDSQAMTITGLKKTYEVGVGVGIPGVATGAKAIPADLTLAGEPTPGKDVAILKIQGSNLPTVPLGDDTRLNTADRLYVVGYPAGADISEASVAVPTLTQGAVSARKTLDNGLTVIQTDAAINPGNSGGPVLDSSGNVVGIATFGMRDANGQKVEGVNFLYPVSLIREMLSRANVTPSESITTQKFDQALSDYNQRYFSRALPEFQAVAELVPGAVFVQEYIQKTQAAISEGKDETPQTLLGMPRWLFFTLLGLLLLVVVGVIVLLLRSRRSTAGPATAPPGAPLPPPAPGTAPVAAAPPPATAAPPAAPAGAPSWSAPTTATTANTGIPAPVTSTAPAAAPTAPTAPVAPVAGAAATAATVAGAAAATHRHGHFCPDCGTPHDEGAHFCPNCGADVS